MIVIRLVYRLHKRQLILDELALIDWWDRLLVTGR